MTPFAELHYLVKAVVMFLLFISAVFSVCIFPFCYSKNSRLLHKILLPLAFLGSFLSAASLRTAIESEKNNFPASDYLQVFYTLPVFVFITIIAFSLIYCFFIVRKEFNRRKKSITSFSIKESIDNLPDGVCYAKENGLVILANHKINELSTTLWGKIFNDANKMWEALTKGEDINQKYITLPGGTIWRFNKELVKVNKRDYIRITAVDVTVLHNLSSDLAKNNEKLKDINRRLKEYSETVDAVVRSRERLETKIKIHRDLGQILLISRYNLTSEEETDYKEIFDKWKFVMTIFKKEETEKDLRDPWKQLLKVADDAAVKVELNGELPKDSNTKKLIVLSCAEALTNAVRHAGATVLYVSITQSEGLLTAEITNNGKKPKGKIIPGGGLGSLKIKLEENAGALKIGSTENGQFKLTITLRS